MAYIIRIYYEYMLSTYAIRLTSMHTVKLIANIKRTHNIRIKGDEVERGIWNSEWMSENSRLYFGMSICLDRNIDLHMIVRYADVVYTRVYATYILCAHLNHKEQMNAINKMCRYITLLAFGNIYTSAIMNLNHCRYLNQNKGEQGNNNIFSSYKKEWFSIESIYHLL
jgi:hypothetical protein